MTASAASAKCLLVPACRVRGEQIEPPVLSRTPKKPCASLSAQHELRVGSNSLELRQAGQLFQRRQIGVHRTNRLPMSIRRPSRPDITMAKQTLIARRKIRQRLTNVIATPSRRIE